MSIRTIGQAETFAKQHQLEIVRGRCTYFLVRTGGGTECKVVFLGKKREGTFYEFKQNSDTERFHFLRKSFTLKNRIDYLDSKIKRCAATSLYALLSLTLVVPVVDWLVGFCRKEEIVESFYQKAPFEGEIDKYDE